MKGQRHRKRTFVDECLELTEDEQRRYLFALPTTSEDEEILRAIPPMFTVRIVVNPETTIQERISQYRQLWKQHGGFDLRPTPWESTGK